MADSFMPVEKDVENLYKAHYKSSQDLWSWRPGYQHFEYLSSGRCINPHRPTKIISNLINTWRTTTDALYWLQLHIQEQFSMSVAYRQAQLSKYRITLEISALEDFNPHQIDWEKLFKLEGKERCEAYVEDLNMSW